ncbi:hypothetical protein BJX65DRAFT_227054 [Aspergillus insuetus]
MTCALKSMTKLSHFSAELQAGCRKPLKVQSLPIRHRKPDNRIAQRKQAWKLHPDENEQCSNRCWLQRFPAAGQRGFPSHWPLKTPRNTSPTNFAAPQASVETDPDPPAFPRHHSCWHWQLPRRVMVFGLRGLFSFAAEPRRAIEAWPCTRRRQK